MKSTILGRLIYGVGIVAGRSTHTKRKIYLAIIGLAFVAALLGFMGAVSLMGRPLWFTILLALGIILVIGAIWGANKEIDKYNLVKDGLEEVKKGNFSHKIPDIGDNEFGRMADTINTITDAQNEAIHNEVKSQRLRSELISNVSHDLRTPLTSMVSYVDLLKSEGLDSPNAEQYLNIISEKTERLHQLTNDLFEAAKASSGDIPVNIEKINLDAMVRQSIAEFEENLAENEIEIVYTCKVENPEVMADGSLLWRVIENLLTNVSKYAMPKTRAYVDIVDIADAGVSAGAADGAGAEAPQSQGRVALEVKNVSRDQLNISAEELMERFQRGDDSRNTDGSGLGLAIASDLASLMNGKFETYIDGDLFKATVELNKA